MIALALSIGLTWLGSAGDVDTDRDGLSDFQEVHKYFTDPAKLDTDGDGTPDGDWSERREYAYSVRAVMDVMAPFDIAVMSDDHQDVRVKELAPDWLRFEVVVYPFDTAGAAIECDSQWRDHAKALEEYTRPGVTTNWDAAMRRELVAALAKDGIDVDSLDDCALAQQASRWLMRNSKYEDGFTVFTAVFVGSDPHVEPRLRSEVDAELAKMGGRSLEEQWRRELFGKSMFEERVHGACTSTAIFLSTALKSLGLPTRTIVCIPVIDATDASERARLDDSITHPTVRKAIRQAMREMRGWTSHTFNEVYVGGRWRRLNGDRLGQPVLDPNTLGLMIHVHTFVDHAESGLIGWALRRQHRKYAELFGGSNPYSCVELSDLVGAHAKIEIPKDETLRELTISRLYWFDDPSRDRDVDFSRPEPYGVGMLLFHVDAPAFAASKQDVLKFYEAVGKEFALRAPGHDEVRVEAARGFWYSPTSEQREFYLRIQPGELAKMEPGVEYELVFRGPDGDRRWRLSKRLAITRPKG